jgi:hypothetical protein
MSGAQILLMIAMVLAGVLLMIGAIALVRWLFPPQDDPEFAEERFHDLLCGDDDEDDSPWFDIRAWPIVERLFRPSPAKLTYRGDRSD